MTTTVDLPRMHPATGNRHSLLKLVVSVVVSRLGIALAIAVASFGIGYPNVVSRSLGLFFAFVLVVAGTWLGLQLARQAEWVTVDGSLRARQPGWWILVRSGMDLVFIWALTPLLVAGSWFDTLTPVFWGWALSLRTLSIMAAILVVTTAIVGFRHRTFWSVLPCIAYGVSSVVLWHLANPIYGVMGWIPAQIPVALVAIIGLGCVIWGTSWLHRRVMG